MPMSSDLPAISLRYARAYTPPDAWLPGYLAVLDTLGFGRGVLCSPAYMARTIPAF